MQTPKGHSGMDWDAITAVMGLIAYACLFLGGLSFAIYVVAHFILKYW